jgi:hypothetical protein
MLQDPLYVRRVPTLIAPGSAVPTVASPFTGAIVSVTGQNVKRSSLPSQNWELGVSHSLSNENPGISTDRHLIRFDVKNVDSVTGKTITTSAYAVITVPHGTDNNADASAQLARELGYFLLYGEVTSAGAPVVGSTSLDRILAGEG